MIISNPLNLTMNLKSFSFSPNLSLPPPTLQIEEVETPSLPSPPSQSPAAPAYEANGDAVSSLRQEAYLGTAPGLGASPAPALSSSSPASGQMESRPSAQESPYSNTSSPLNGSATRVGGQHSVISVDEGTSSRGLLSSKGVLFFSYSFFFFLCFFFFVFSRILLPQVLQVCQLFVNSRKKWFA